MYVHTMCMYNGMTIFLTNAPGGIVNISNKYVKI